MIPRTLEIHLFVYSSSPYSVQLFQLLCVGTAHFIDGAAISKAYIF